MRKWIAGKLFELAAWLDWDAVVIAPTKRVGRPLGSKDKKPRKRPVRKAGRPLPIANGGTGAETMEEVKSWES